MTDRPHTAEFVTPDDDGSDDVMRPLEPEVAESFTEFWEHLVAPDGEWDFDQVKRELHDYRVVMAEASKVYYEITLCAPASEAVLGVHEDLWRFGDDIECAACDGTGDYEEYAENGTCPLCEGKGELTPERLKAIAAEVAMLRHVLVFADGFATRYGYHLAELYNETTPLQGVIARAGCYPRSGCTTPWCPLHGGAHNDAPSTATDGKQTESDGAADG